VSLPCQQESMVHKSFHGEGCRGYITVAVNEQDFLAWQGN
jgi:hypothetical protein